MPGGCPKENAPVVDAPKRPEPKSANLAQRVESMTTLSGFKSSTRVLLDHHIKAINLVLHCIYMYIYRYHIIINILIYINILSYITNSQQQNKESLGFQVFLYQRVTGNQAKYLDINPPIEQTMKVGYKMILKHIACLPNSLKLFWLSFG